MQCPFDFFGLKASVETAVQEFAYKDGNIRVACHMCSNCRVYDVLNWSEYRKSINRHFILVELCYRWWWMLMVFTNAFFLSFRTTTCYQAILLDACF